MSSAPASRWIVATPRGANKCGDPLLQAVYRLTLLLLGMLAQPSKPFLWVHTPVTGTASHFALNDHIQAPLAAIP